MAGITPRRIIVIGAFLTTGFVLGFSQGTLKPLSGKSSIDRNIATIMAMPTLFSEHLASAFRLPAARAGNPVTLEPYETYLAVRDTIMTEYANPPKDAKANREWPNKLNNMAIKGMVASVGDIYTEYWTPDEFKKQMETTSGSFGGVGARLDVRDHKPLIVEPIPNSPAMAKGLMSGDLIRAVDGKSAVISPSQRLDDVIKRIKGEPGTKVRLTIERKGTKPFDVDLVRAIVTSPVVDSWMLYPANGIGYVKLDQFTEQADVQVAAAIAKLQTQGMKALVFDLRGNPGGLLTVARDLVSRFVGEGPVVWTKERQGGMVSLNVDSKKTIAALSSGSIPVVVLVNGSSASASEIVSGALQDANAAFIIGTRTYGKGLVQTILPLGETGGAVKVTTQHYFTRDKHDINLKRDENGEPVGEKGGIRPDRVVAEDDKDLDAQRKIMREQPGNRKAAIPISKQVQTAIAVLKDKLAGSPWPASEKDDLAKQDSGAKRETGE